MKFTKRLPVSTCKHDSLKHLDGLVTVKGFHSTFDTAGGINLPKIVYCLGSDKKLYKQLVKGRDDLRQDAVMQQIFGMVNRLLKAEDETRLRSLAIRGYNVIPTSPNSGILEWVQNSLPLGAWLTGPAGNAREGAHERYPFRLDTLHNYVSVL